jgi:hypothetical protein
MQAAPGDTLPPAAPSQADAVRAAVSWLAALRGRDREQLRELSGVPFEFQELAEYPKCGTRRAEKRVDVAEALACALDDSLLMEELLAQSDPIVEAIGQSQLPEWAGALKGALLSGGQLVQVRLPGNNGVSYQFLLLATQAGITRVWKFAEYDSN